MLDQKEELKLAEKRTKAYFFSIFLFLGIAIFALLSARINIFDAYTSYLNGATIISGGIGLVDIGIYLFSRKMYIELKDRTKNMTQNSTELWESPKGKRTKQLSAIDTYSLLALLAL